MRGRRNRVRGCSAVEVIHMADGMTGRTHLVAVSDVETAIVAEQGWFPALCGHRVAVSSLSTPLGVTCAACCAAGRGGAR